MAEAKFLMFTWQPTWLLFEGDACDFKGQDNLGPEGSETDFISYVKDKKYFKLLLAEGAKLKHDRQWELLAVRSLEGGDLSIFTIDPINDDEQEIEPYAVVTENTEKKFSKILGAGEELVFKTAATDASFMVLVREYNSGKRGD